jgi:hypothetical protein
MAMLEKFQIKPPDQASKIMFKEAKKREDAA